MLYTDNYIEVALTATGWDIYTKLFSFIYTLNLHYIPFIWVMISNWKDTRKSQEAGQASIVEWRRNYIDIYSMMIVVILFWIPNKHTTFDASEYVKAIQLEVERNNIADSTESSSEANIAFRATDQAKQYGNIPIPPGLWFVTMSIKAFTNQMTEWIESGYSPHMRSLLTAFTTMKIKDNNLKAEVNEFYSSCYMPALYRYQNETQQPIPLPDQNDDLNYIGNKLFLDTPGYYKSCSSSQKASGSCYGNPERMPYKTAEQYGVQTTFMLDEPNANGETVQFATSPSCYIWWTGKRDIYGYSEFGDYEREGLKSRLANYEITEYEGIGNWVKSTFGNSPDEDLLVKKLLKSDAPELISTEAISTSSDKSFFQKAWDIFQGGFATIGAGISTFLLGIVLELMKPGLLMVQAGIIMTIIMLMAIVLPFGAFKPGVVAALIVYLIGAMLLSLWWAIAGWIDEGMISILFPDIEGAEDLDVSLNNFLYLLSVFFFYLGIPVYFGKMIAVAGHDAFEITRDEISGLTDAGKSGADVATKVKR